MNVNLKDIRKLLEPKSDQLNYDDVAVKDLVVKISGVRAGSQQQPLVLELEGYRDYKPCKSMMRVLAAVWGKDSTKWVGKWMKLYGDPTVTFGASEVGGIRIRAVSHINGRKSMPLTTKRGRREKYTVVPLEPPTKGADESLEDVLDRRGVSMAQADAWAEMEGKDTPVSQLDPATAAKFARWLNSTERGEQAIREMLEVAIPGESGEDDESPALSARAEAIMEEWRDAGTLALMDKYRELFDEPAPSGMGDDMIALQVAKKITEGEE